MPNDDLNLDAGLESPQDRVRRIGRRVKLPDDITDDYLATTKVESGHNINVRNSPKGAQGFGQVMPDVKGGTTRTVGGRKYNLRDPEENIEAGIRYFAEGGNDPVRRRLHYFGGPKAAKTYDRTGRIPNISDGNMTAAQYVKATGGQKPRVNLDAGIDLSAGLVDEQATPAVEPRGRFAGTAALVASRRRPKQGRVEASGLGAPLVSIADVRQRDNEQIQRINQAEQATFEDLKRKQERLKLQYPGAEAANIRHQIKSDDELKRRAAQMVGAQVDLDVDRPRIDAVKAKLRELVPDDLVVPVPASSGKLNVGRMVEGAQSAIANSGVQAGNLIQGITGFRRGAGLTKEMRIAQQALAELDAEDPDKGWQAAVERGLPAAAIELAKMTMLSRVPVAGRATLPALGALSEADQGIGAAAKGAAIGELYHRGFGAMRNLPKAAQFGVGTAVPAGIAIAEGADPKRAIIENTAFGAMALASGRKPISGRPRQPMPEVPSRQAAPTLTPSELAKRTALREGVVNEPTQAIKPQPNVPPQLEGAKPRSVEDTKVVVSDAEGLPTTAASEPAQPIRHVDLQQRFKRGSKAGDFKKETRVQAEERRQQVNPPQGGVPSRSQAPPILRRNFRAGMNNAELQFSSELQRDLYDLGAKMRYQMRGGQNKTSDRIVGDIEVLRKSLIDRGVPESEVTKRAFDTLDDIKAQMKGVKDGETRAVKDNISPAATPPVQPSPPAPKSQSRVVEIESRAKSDMTGTSYPYNLPEGTHRFRVEPSKSGERFTLIPVNEQGNPIKIKTVQGDTIDRVGVSKAMLERDFSPPSVVGEGKAATVTSAIQPQELLDVNGVRRYLNSQGVARTVIDKTVRKLIAADKDARRAGKMSGAQGWFAADVDAAVGSVQVKTPAAVYSEQERAELSRLKQRRKELIEQYGDEGQKHPQGRMIGGLNPAAMELRNVRGRILELESKGRSAAPQPPEAAAPRVVEPAAQPLKPETPPAETNPPLPPAPRSATPRPPAGAASQAETASIPPSTTSALKTPEPEMKTSKLARGVEAKAIEAKLTEGFRDLPEYETVKVADQAAKASELLKSDPEKAVKIAKGEELPSADLLPESVFVAVENQALREGNVELLRELATTHSSLSTEATGMGQRIRMLGERNPYSPVTAIKQVQEARQAKAERIHGNKKKVVEKIKSEITVEIKKAAPKMKSWSDFLETIKC